MSPTFSTSLTTSSALLKLSQPLQEEISHFIKGRIQNEQAPREHVDINDDVPSADICRLVQHNMEQFAIVYDADLPAAGDDGQSCVHPRSDEQPQHWKPGYVLCLMRFITTVEWQLFEGVKRLKGTIGRELPAYVMNRFLPQVPAQLRQALRLNDVSAGVHKRAASLCEPDEDVVTQRELLKKRRKALEHLQ